MPNFHDAYQRKLTTPDAALKGLPRRAGVLLGFFAAQPPALIGALMDQVRAGSFDELRVRYMHATTATAEAMLRPELMDVVKPHPFYIGENERALIKAGGERAERRSSSCPLLHRPGAHHLFRFK